MRDDGGNNSVYICVSNGHCVAPHFAIEYIGIYKLVVNHYYFIFSSFA